MGSLLVTAGFLPVVVFLIVDAFAGKRAALWNAMGVTAAVLVAEALRGPAPGFAEIASFALLAALTALSMRRRDDFFFKIHGAVLGILGALILFAYWSGLHRAVFLEPQVRDQLLDLLVSGNPGLNREAAREVLRLLSLTLPWGILLHALLTLHAAANWGKWAWALVRIPGFFLAWAAAYGVAMAAALQGTVK